MGGLAKAKQFLDLTKNNIDEDLLPQRHVVSHVAASVVSLQLNYSLLQILFFPTTKTTTTMILFGNIYPRGMYRKDCQNQLK